MTFRVRSAGELSDNPFDGAGIFRLALSGAALLLAGAVVLGGLSRRQRHRVALPLFLKWYGVYVVVAAFGITRAVQPQVVVFRVFELVIALVVVAALFLAFDGRLERPVRLLLGFVVLLAVLVLLGAVLAPGQALAPARGGVVPFRLAGIFPALSYNSVGTLGLFLTAFSVTRKQWQAPLMLGTGLLLIVLAQYRTGYVALVVMLAYYLAVRRNGVALATLAVVTALGYALFSSGLVSEALTRGEQQSGSVATLSGRTNWWAVGVEVASRSPVIGTGLSSGTRFEVLNDRLGLSRTSTIHSTWVEAYVGTGLLGSLALLVAVGLVCARLSRTAGMTGYRLGLALLIVSVLPRSLTGTTVELAGLNLMVFLIAAAELVRTGATSPPEAAGPLRPPATKGKARAALGPAR